MSADAHGNATPPRRSPWSDGVERPLDPMEVGIGLEGGFSPALAAQVLADPYLLAYLNRYMSRYMERNGHLPYDYQLRLERECAHPTPEGDADLRVALAIGYGVPDDAFDALLEELDDWHADAADAGAGVTMGAIDFDRDLADLFAPVLLGDGGTQDGDASVAPALGDSVGDWDAAFTSQRCRVLARRDPHDGTLAVRLDYPDGDGMRRITLRFADGGTLELDADIRRGTWRCSGIATPSDGMPLSCTVW